MGSATRAVELLCETDMLKALQIANEIDELNASRQKIEKEIFAQAIEKIEKNKLHHDRVIVVNGENWHHGVVGIVASRICERYGTPAIVLSSDGNMAHGSGRSFRGLSLFDAVSSCKDLLQKFGGHDLACGLTISNDNIDMPISSTNDIIENTPTPIPSGVTTHIEINEDFMISLLFTLTKEAPIIKIFDYLTQQNILHRLYLPRNTNLKNLILSRQFQLLQYFCSQNFFTSKYRKFTSSLYCIETMKIINGIRERIEFLEINYTDVAELNKLNENDLNTFMKTLSLNNEKIYESLEQNLKKYSVKCFMVEKLN
jgi:hypothetical protein